MIYENLCSSFGSALINNEKRDDVSDEYMKIFSNVLNHKSTKK